MRILLFTPYTASGHLDLWRNEIRNNYIRNGHDVIDLNPATFFSHEYFRDVQFNDSPFGENFPDAIRKRTGILKYSDKVPVVVEKIKIIIPKWLWRRLKPARTRLLRVLFVSDPGSNFKKSIKKGIFSDNLSYQDFYFQIKMTLLMEQNVDLVLITYFDGLDNLTLENWFELEKSLKVSFSIIYFKMTPHIMDAIERSSYIRSIGTVNDPKLDAIGEISLRDKIIVRIPDFPTVKISNNSQSNQDNRIFASDAPVIGLIGSIDFRKNVDLFLKCALSEAGLKYNWLIVGKIHFGGLRSKTCKSIESALQDKFPNLKVVSEYLSDSDYLNWYEKVDVHFLMYLNWNYASNSLTNCIYNRDCAILNSDSEIFRDAASKNLGIETESTPEAVFASINRFKEFKMSEIEREKYLKINSATEFERKVLTLLESFYD